MSFLAAFFFCTTIVCAWGWYRNQRLFNLAIKIANNILHRMVIDAQENDKESGPNA